MSAKECYLQTFIGTPKSKKGEEILKQELWWNIIEMRNQNPMEPSYKYVLLKFKSITDRDKFKKIYCQGQRMLGPKTFIVRYSPWKDVPNIFLNLDGIYICEKMSGDKTEEKAEAENVKEKLGLSILENEKPIAASIDMIKLENIVLTREKNYACAYPIKISFAKPLSDSGLRKLAAYAQSLYFTEQ